MAKFTSLIRDKTSLNFVFIWKSLIESRKKKKKMNCCFMGFLLKGKDNILTQNSDKFP